MKRLLALRHAKSSWKDEGLDDHDRPLNKRGQRDAPRMGRLLVREDIAPQMIISSTAVRARRTAQATAEACGFEGDLRTTRELYLGGPSDYTVLLGRLPSTIDAVMVVGHNPGLEELVQRLTGEQVTMPTAALAQIALAVDDWSAVGAGTGRLVQLWLPRELPDDL